MAIKYETGCVMTVSLRDMRRCCRERGLLIVKPFAGGYSFGSYVEHCQHNGGVWATLLTGWKV